MTDVYSDNLQAAEQLSNFIDEFTCSPEEYVLLDFILPTLDKLYIAESVIETEQLQIFANNVEATNAGIPIKGYYYDYYGSLQIAGNVPNLLLDLSNPISHFLRSF